MEILTLADDLTGALEAGAKLGGVMVTTRRDFNDGGPLLVIDTETRHVSPDEAARIVTECARPAGIIYKKTDSTLRGNIAAEIGALTRLFPGHKLHYVGAYPALGRTVHAGKVYVDGVPVHQTAFSRDSLNPVTSSSIRELLHGIDCNIWDGQTDEDVRQATGTILSAEAPAIIAGPASVASHLATTILRPQWPRIAQFTILGGSLHPASLSQLEAARRSLPPNCRIVEWHQRSAIRDDPSDGLIVFGGDTAREVAESLGVSEFEPLGEVVPGVPVSRMRGRERYLISKAGGYGGPDLIFQILRILHA